MLRLVICTAFVLFSSPALLFAQGVTHIVDDDGGGTAADCDISTSAFTTVAAAIAAAGSGDTVLVCPGTYVENINFGGKAIAVRSISGPAVTILDGNATDAVVTFDSGETTTSVLEGFTIRNGLATSLPNGGGIRIGWASPVIRRNAIVNNRACSGPGILIQFGSPLIEENTIANNNTREGCFSGTSGGGIYVDGASTPVIRGNNINNNGGVAYGGGISSLSPGFPTIDRNVIWANSAWAEGGGMLLLNSDATITGNVIVGNRPRVT